MMEEDEIRRRLDRLMAKTASADRLDAGLGGYWVGDVAGKRVAQDSLNTGRLHWRSARDSAEHGIKAINRGDIEGAEEFVLIATDFYIEALETRIRPSDLEFLSTSPQRRGRPKN